jgi:hypothetical protein
MHGQPEICFWSLSMNRDEQLAVFNAQTENVRYLQKTRKQIIRPINDSLREGHPDTAKLYTRLYVLLYSIWIEAIFSKLIHTPYGFSMNEIQQIKDEQTNNGLAQGWRKCVELGTYRIAPSPKGNYVPNVRQRILRIVKDYVDQPSVIRNKIAHGQWVNALNRANDSVNYDITRQLNDLDVVVIDKWFGVAEKLVQLVENLIESPERAFNRDYWGIVTELENYVEKVETWNLADKVKKLQDKKNRTQSSQ